MKPRINESAPHILLISTSIVNQLSARCPTRTATDDFTPRFQRQICNINQPTNVWEVGAAKFPITPKPRAKPTLHLAQSPLTSQPIRLDTNRADQTRDTKLCRKPEMRKTLLPHPTNPATATFGDTEAGSSRFRLRTSATETVATCAL